jgi:hypothetical protein
MKKTIISSMLILLFLGSLLFAQASDGIQLQPVPPRPGGIIPILPRPRTPPDELAQLRYYEGEAIVNYGSTNSISIKGKAYVWVERIPSKNLFRGRYVICYNERRTCDVIAYSRWIEGREHDGVWFIRQSNLDAILGPEQGYVRLDEGRRIVIMRLRLKPVSISEPVPPIEILQG